MGFYIAIAFVLFVILFTCLLKQRNMIVVWIPKDSFAVTSMFWAPLRVLRGPWYHFVFPLFERLTTFPMTISFLGTTTNTVVDKKLLSTQPITIHFPCVVGPPDTRTRRMVTVMWTITNPMLMAAYGGDVPKLIVDTVAMMESTVRPSRVVGEEASYIDVLNGVLGNIGVRICSLAIHGVSLGTHESPEQRTPATMAALGDPVARLEEDIKRLLKEKMPKDVIMAYASTYSTQ